MSRTAPRTAPRAARWGATAGAGVLAAAAIGAAVAAPAQAAPVTLAQIPATALAVSGLVVPGPWFATVTADTTGKPGELRIAAPASQSICATSAGSALVRVSYASAATGRTGSVTVRPCPNFLSNVPTSAVIHPGTGTAVFSIQVTGSAAYPNAGQPSLPGIGGVVVP